MKRFVFRSLAFGATLLLVLFILVQVVRAQGFPFSKPGGPAQVNQGQCDRIAELARSMPGIDPQVFAARLGCRLEADAPKSEGSAAPSEAETQATRLRASNDKTCSVLAGALSGALRSGPDFWLGPLPVINAGAYAERCFDRGALPAAQDRLQEGLMRFGAGQFRESADAFREGMAQANSDEMRTRLLAEMGKSLLAAGRTDEARSAFGQALSLNEKDAQQALAQPQRARRRTVVMDNAGRMQVELLVLAGLAQLQANDVAGAIERLRDANALVQGQGTERSFVPPYLALALQRAGRFDEARVLLEAALTKRESMLRMVGAGQPLMEMKVSSLGTMGAGSLAGAFQQAGARSMEAAGMMTGEYLPSFACPLLEQIHTQGNAPEQALEAAERCRGRALTRLLAKRALREPPPSIPEGAAKPGRPGAGLAAGMAGPLKEISGNPAAELASRPATIADMRRMAAERRATVVVYSITSSINQLPNRMPDRETGIRIWVVSPEGLVSMRQRGFEGVLDSPDDTHALTASVMRAREVFGVAGRGPVAAVDARTPRVTRASNALRRLHRLLIDPVADLLPDKAGARVLLVPQGALFLVPFAALEDAAGAPLISRYALSVAPSMQTLALTALRKQASRATGPSLIVGNPVMPRYSPGPGMAALEVPDLPGAEEEARSIGSLLKASPLTGAAATKSAVIRDAREARYIHLATHGFLNDFAERAQRNASPYLRNIAMLGSNEESVSRTPGMLALAPSGADSGMLTADEIAEATTHAGLVVMSACDSGRGAINDEGVLGLSRAWMAAGAPSVIVSLWAIPDEPTRDLMVDLYGRLEAGAGKAEALREAMLATRAKYPKTAYWAAFVLLGEPD